MMACKKDKDGTPAVVIPAVGITFSSAIDTVDMNTTSNTKIVYINVGDSITKTELEARLKLKFTNSDDVTDSLVRIKTMEITEAPLTVKLELEAIPNLERAARRVEISFDESMQPLTVGEHPTFTLTLLPHAPAATWYKAEANYAPYVYYKNASGNWATLVGHFPVLVENDAAVLGFVNNYVANSGIALFNMVRIYSAQLGTNASAKSAMINVPEMLEFIPERAGAVKVIEQDVVLTRTNGTTFKIGISGGGTYSEDTGLIELDITFDDTDINGAAVNTYPYKISVNKLTF
jgi:hypothetical protein